MKIILKYSIFGMVNNHRKIERLHTQIRKNSCLLLFICINDIILIMMTSNMCDLNNTQPTDKI